jgi:hypothetical protein
MLFKSFFLLLVTLEAIKSLASLISECQLFITAFCSPGSLSFTSSIKAVDELSFLWPVSVSLQAHITINNLCGLNYVNNPLTSSNCI